MLRWAAIVGYVLLFAIAAADLIAHPQLWDAADYKRIAEKFAAQGYGASFGSWRAIGYPTLLYPLALVGAPLPATAVGLQGLFYFAAALWLSAEVSARDQTLGDATLLGLLLNPFNVWLLNTTLTEATTVILFIVLAALLLRMEQSTRPVTLLILGTGLAAYAIQIRSASITMFVAWCIAAIMFVVQRKVSWRDKVAVSVSAVVVVALASAPQLAYNVRTFGVYSIFPAGSLWEAQVKLGVKNAKYGSSADSSHYGPLLYANPFYDGADLPKSAIWWYVQNPLRGLGTAALHVFNGFNFDYHATYIYDLTPPFPWLFPFLMWTVFVAGVLTVAMTRRNIPLGLPVVAFVVLASFFTLAQISVIVVDNRYNLLPTTVLGVMAAYGVLRFYKSPKWLCLVIVSSAVLTVGSEMMRTLIVK